MSIVHNGFSVTLGWNGPNDYRDCGMFEIDGVAVLAWGAAYKALSNGRPWEGESNEVDGVREFATYADMDAYFDWLCVKEPPQRQAQAMRPALVPAFGNSVDGRAIKRR